MTASYQRKVVVPIEYLGVTRNLFQGTRDAHKHPGTELQILTVMMVLVSQDTFQVHGSASPKHLRKMVDGHLCKTIAVCVIKTTTHENLLTMFLYFKIVTWKFLSLSATALFGLC